MKKLIIYISFLIFTGIAFGQGAISFDYPQHKDPVVIGNELTIKWSAWEVEKVKIEYSTDYGNTWNLIEDNVDAMTGNYKWIVPDFQTEILKIRVSDINNYSRVYDFSSNLPLLTEYIPLSKMQVSPDKVLADPNVLEIMPLGNSITRGTGSTNINGYRKPLDSLLKSVGYSIEFLGDLVDGEFTNNHHSGYYGRHAHHWNNNRKFSLDYVLVDSSLFTKYDPDIILLHIGTNDINSFTLEQYWGGDFIEYDNLVDTTVWDTNNLLNQLLSGYGNPSLPIFVAQITKVQNTDNSDNAWGYPDYINEEQGVYDYNDGLAATVSSTFHLVDMESVVPFSAIPDSVHPNDSGYVLMANKWFDEIQKYFSPALASPANNVTVDSLNVLLEWNPPDGEAIAPETMYYVEIDNDSDFSSPVFIDSVLDLTTINASGLEYSTPYHWQVQAKNFDGRSYWSNSRSFTTESAPPTGVVVSAKVFLEGPFNGIDMNISLASGGYLPTIDPYGEGESVADGFDFAANNIVDWVLVELRDSTTPSTIEGTRAGLLKSDGTIVDTNGSSLLNFSGLPVDNYYIAVKHRNHLAIMSSSADLLSSTSELYDFTTAQSKATGTNPMKDLGGSKFGMFAGDANADGGIFGEDYTDYKLNQGMINYIQSDFNLDSGVFGEDYTIYKLNQGTLSQVP